jgi:DNA-binding NtrC family response regulator
MLDWRQFQMIGQFSNVAGIEPRNISRGSGKFPAKRVLIVDDEHLVRWAIAETLSERGYEISEAADGKSAKHAVMRPDGAPDLVLLDLRLPDSDDLGVLSFIRTHSAHTAIVLMTAYGTPEIIDQAHELGALVVGKPFDVNELNSIVERALTLSAA